MLIKSLLRSITIFTVNMKKFVFDRLVIIIGAIKTRYRRNIIASFGRAADNGENNITQIDSLSMIINNAHSSMGREQAFLSLLIFSISSFTALHLYVLLLFASVKDKKFVVCVFFTFQNMDRICTSSGNAGQLGCHVRLHDQTAYRHKKLFIYSF